MPTLYIFQLTQCDCDAKEKYEVYRKRHRNETMEVYIN